VIVLAAATHRPSGWVGLAIVVVLVFSFGVAPALILNWKDARNDRSDR
jgi:hypothetical protein